MAMDNSRTEKLALYVERWLEQSPRRSIQMLSRNTNIPYPTLRRVVQREGEPNLDTTLTLLNYVATLEETLDYLYDIRSISQFYKRVTANATLARQEILEKFSCKDSFWIICLGMTVGATKDRVQQLLGLSGLAKLEEMVAEGLLKEREFEVYKTDADTATLFFHSDREGKAAVGHVNDMPPNGRFFEQVAVVNVNETGLNIMMDSLKEAFQKGVEAAKENEGSILVSFAYVGKELLQVKGGV